MWFGSLDGRISFRVDLGNGAWAMPGGGRRRAERARVLDLTPYFLNRSELDTTDTELNAIATEAMMGLRRMWKNG